MARAMGLDVGDSRIGVALSDPLGVLATPLTIITRGDIEDDVAAILKIARQHSVESIVVGLPLNMDGSRGAQAEKVHNFADELARRIELPVRFQDERLSTVEAMRLFKEAGKPSRGARYDAAAAALILQAHLDEHAVPPELPPD
jgi:putative holliday junction resolvase